MSMQLYCSLSGVVISSRSSSYVGGRLQVAAAGGGGGSRAASAAGASSSSSSCVVGVRSEKADDLWQQLLGGRGLPGGEEVLKNESKLSKVLLEFEGGGGGGGGAATVEEEEEEEEAAQQKIVSGRDRDEVEAGTEGFEKEMMGLTGGFPGGEKGLKRFIATSTIPQLTTVQPPPQQRPRAPAPPLLMPGMTVIVKNQRNPFYMYSGIVQRVSDGRVGVLFEGGNWDKLLTFYLEDLERTAKGPPMINPKSAILLQRPPPPTPPR